MLCSQAADESSRSHLPGVHEDGTARDRPDPIPPVRVSSAAAAAAEPLHAPEVLGAGEAAPVRDAAAERVHRRHLHRHGRRRAARHVDDGREQRLRRHRGVAPVPAEAVHEPTRERAEQVRDGGDPQPVGGAVQETGGGGGAAAEAGCAAHLEAEHAAAVPRARHRPRRRRRGQELLHAAPLVSAVSLVVDDREERAPGMRVVEDGADVGGEELDVREPAAVEALGVAGGEAQHRGAARGPEAVGVDGVHEEGRRPELGVAAAAGEEPERRLVGPVRGHVRVLGAHDLEPLLQPPDQQQSDAHPPARKQIKRLVPRSMVQC
ncbi:unnamed protein product [Urochloa decumbens]|uniref:Uncharacterized protein n=1 Tax=Urochloa decumbens TaxID=240449 RepID=A0ABC8Y6R6_9POAL